MDLYRELDDLPNYLVYDSGQIWSIPRPRTRGGWLSPTPTDQGYLTFKASRPGVRPRTLYVHQVVCRAFRGEKPDWADTVRHLDGVVTNNRASNLLWGTWEEQARDRQSHGTPKQWEKISAQDVEEIRVLYATGAHSQGELAHRFGVTQGYISNIVRRKVRTLGF